MCVCIFSVEPVLVGKVSALLESLQSNFKTLALLHDEAVKTGASELVDVISAGISSHRALLANWEQTAGIKKVDDTQKNGNGGRKRSSTSPLDMRIKKDRSINISGSIQPIAGGREVLDGHSGSTGRSSTRSSLLQGTVRQLSEVDDGQCRRKVTVSAGDSERTELLMVGDASSGDKDRTDDQEDLLQESHRDTPSKVTLTVEQVQEAKDLIHKLMGFFPS